MVKLFCDHSPALIRLYRDREIALDGVEFTPFNTPGQIEALRADYPGLAFQFHASNVGRVPFSLHKLNRYQRACPESAWVSIHLSLVPSWILYLALRKGISLPLPAPRRMENRFIRQVKRLAARTDLPLLLENMPATPVLDNAFESDPATIGWLTSALDTGMLLDLAHVQVAAAFHTIDVKVYLARLPLERVRQIHLSGTREVDGVLRDAHEPLQDTDYDLLDWTLRRTKPEMVTLEYFREDETALKEMLIRLRQCLEVISPTE